MKKLLTITPILFAIVVTTTCNAQYNYPPTKTVDSSDTYFGVTYKDPYRWLENMKDPQVVDWFKQQANFSNSILNKISGRDELIAEWKKMDGLQPPSIDERYKEGGRYFYTKKMPGEKVSKLYYRKGINGKEELLFDPMTYIKGKSLSINSYLPSHDGEKIVIAYTEGGKEVSTLKIMDVKTKKYLPETINSSYRAYSWTFDNKAFLYNSLNNSDNTSADFKLNPKTRLHKLGDDVKNDIDFLSDSSYPKMGIKPNEFPDASLREDSRDFIFANVRTTQRENLIYYAPISQFNSGKIAWKILCRPEDKIVRSIIIMGNDVYAITYKGAKNYKLVHTTLTNPDWDKAETIAEEKPNETLEGISHCKDYLFLDYTNGINDHYYKYQFKTKKLAEIKFPYSGVFNVWCLDDTTNNCYAGITSWNKPRTEFDFNASTDKFLPSSFNKPPVFPAAYEDLEVKEVEVKGYDGVLIPLSIIYKKGTRLDGNNTCLMQGYGAYGYSAVPYFDYKKNSLAVKGVIIAMAHVRGGSEKGEAWYKAGFKTTKPNTWKDFNSCAEYLIENGYTSANKLAGMGTSAGGILISRAITERPDLYAAAICNVGVANAMRMEFTPNGPANIPEFGTVKDSIECRALYEMDGMQHVVKGTKYPAVICVGGWNDPRVIAWEPGKFAAALQNATTSGKPVLMKVNYDNGHFTEDLYVTFANFADMYAFALWQCGDKNFQMK